MKMYIFYLTIAASLICATSSNPVFLLYFSPSFSREIFRGAERTVENRRESCSSIKSRLSSAKTVQERGQNLFRNVCTSLDCKWMRCNTVLTVRCYGTLSKNIFSCELRIPFFFFFFSILFFFFLEVCIFFFSLPSNDDFLARFVTWSN